MSSQGGKGRTSGILPVNAATTRKAPPAKPGQRTPTPRLRLIVRRLAPGLTEDEFWDALGSEWKVNSGKIESAVFQQGKISKDPAKPSKPGRAYLKVKDQTIIDELSVKVRQTTFQDGRHTSKDSCLVGPPSLEFAPYNKVASGRSRNDRRQGTIDQDPEFIAFLQSLTEPITKPGTDGAEAAEASSEKVTITPLVQFIKEKKANKAKEKEAAVTAKVSKKTQENKENKAAVTKTEPRSNTKTSTKGLNLNEAEKARVAKATQETVKAINRSMASMQNQPPTPKSSQAKNTPIQAAIKEESVASTTAPAKKERQRGDASVAARMVARDLGLVPKDPPSSRSARKQNAEADSPLTKKASAAGAPDVGSSTSQGLAPNPSAQDTAVNQTPSSAPPTGPRNQKNQTKTKSQSQAQTQAPAQLQPQAEPTKQDQSSNTNQKQTKGTPQPSAGAKSAFLKHANPSQGVTEEALQIAFAEFGTIARCEIDKKKGLAYIDFIDHEGLKKAMATSPVKVGNSHVIVLENRSPYTRKPQQSSQGASGGGKGPRGKSGSKASSVKSPSLSAASSPRSSAAKPLLVTQPLTVPVEAAAEIAMAKDPVADSDAQAKQAEGKQSTENTSQSSGTPRNSCGGRSGGHRGRGGHRTRGEQGRGGRGGNDRDAGTSASATTTTAVTAPPAPVSAAPANKTKK